MVEKNQPKRSKSLFFAEIPCFASALPMDSPFAMSNVTIRSLNDLQNLLPRLASVLSMTRAQLVIDQLRHLVEQSRGDELIVLTCEHTSGITSDTPRQSAIVVHHDRRSDFATMLLMGWSAGPAHVDDDDRTNGENELAQIEYATTALTDVLDPILYQRGVRFMQFATDVAGPSSDRQDFKRRYARVRVAGRDATATHWQP